MHMHWLLLLCSLRVSSEYKVNTWFSSIGQEEWSHTRWRCSTCPKTQFYVLLPSGCQGQVLGWGCDARPRRVGTVSRLASKHNLFSIQIQNNSQQQKTKATMFPLQGCKIKEIQHQHTTKEGRIYKRRS